MQKHPARLSLPAGAAEPAKPGRRRSTP